MGLLRMTALGAIGYAAYRYLNREQSHDGHVAFAPGESGGANFAKVRNAGPERRSERRKLPRQRSAVDLLKRFKPTGSGSRGQPQSNRSGQSRRRFGCDAFGVYLRDQGVDGDAFIGSCLAQHFPEQRLQADRGFMASDLHRAFDWGVVERCHHTTCSAAKGDGKATG
jgi:hypothetical protein